MLEGVAASQATPLRIFRRLHGYDLAVYNTGSNLPTRTEIHDL